MIPRDGVILVMPDNSLYERAELRQLVQQYSTAELVVLKQSEVPASITDDQLLTPSLVHSVYPGTNVPMTVKPNRRMRRAARR